jgi:hypothetical protein
MIDLPAKKCLLKALLFAALTLPAWFIFSFSETHEAFLLRRSFNVVNDSLPLLAQYPEGADFENEEHYLKPILQFSHPGVRVPVIARDDFRAFNWSNDKQVYRTKKGMKIYYNYTIYYNKDGRRQKRFTKSEFIPKPENVIRKRGFTVDYTTDPADVKKIAQHLDTYEDPYRFEAHFSWRWNQPSPDQPALIPMCYRNQQSYDQLHEWAEYAINTWHSVLGANRGVQFSILCNKFCYGSDGNPASDYAEDTVVIVYVPGRSFRASVGWIPFQQNRRHNLQGDPSIYPRPESMNEDEWREVLGSFSVHELGVYQQNLSAFMTC